MLSIYRQPKLRKFYTVITIKIVENLHIYYQFDEQQYGLTELLLIKLIPKVIFIILTAAVRIRSSPMVYGFLAI